MSNYNVQQIDAIVNAGNHARICLYDENNRKILGWNTSKAKLSDWWKRIRAQLTDANLEKGNYQVIMKRSASNDAVQEVFTVPAGQKITGTRVQMSEGIQQQQPPPPSTGNDFMQLLTLQTDKVRVETENSFLKRENEDLKRQISDLNARNSLLSEDMDEYREEIRLMADQAKPSQFTTLATSAIPFIEKYLDMQEKKLEIAKNEAKDKETAAAIKEVPEHIKRLVQLEIGEYFDVQHCNIENFLSYFQGLDGFNIYLQQLRAESPSNAEILTSRVTAFMQSQTPETNEKQD